MRRRCFNSLHMNFYLYPIDIWHYFHRSISRSGNELLRETARHGHLPLFETIRRTTSRNDDDCRMLHVVPGLMLSVDSSMIASIQPALAFVRPVASDTCHVV